MASLQSVTLEAGMREMMHGMIEDVTKANDEEAAAFGINGTGLPINIRGKRIAFWNSFNSSGSYMAEGGNFPPAGGSKLAAWRCFVTTYAFTAAYTGRFIDSLSTPETMITSLQPYMDRDRKIILDNKAQDQFGDGSGMKGIVSAISSLVITCYATVASGSTFGAMKFLDGERVSWIDPVTKLYRVNGGSTAFTSVIADGGVDNPNRQITVDAVPSDGAVNDILVRENSYGQAITGLLKACAADSLDFQGVNRGKFKRTRAANFNASNAPLSYSNTNVLKYRMRVRGAKNVKRRFCTSVTITQGVENLGHGMRRSTQQDTQQNLSYGGDFRLDDMVPEVFLYCPADAMFFVPQQYMEWNVLTALQPQDKDGTVLHMAPTSSGAHSDNYLVYYKEEADLGYTNTRQFGLAQGWDISGLELACDSADLG